VIRKSERRVCPRLGVAAWSSMPLRVCKI